MTTHRTATTLTTIATVTSPVREGIDESWGEVISHLELRPEYAGALRGLEAFSHALVIFWMHQSHFTPDHLVRHPQGRQDLPKIGMFAQRAKHRPNPIGVTAVEIVRVEGNTLSVRGLDAIDGTPVLDIKPYFPWFDRVPEPRTPDWCEKIMSVYF